MTNFTMAIDQYGQHWDDLGKFPRKALLEQLGSKHADKMYVDKVDGTSVHIGYIISGLWLTLYSLTRIEKTN